MLKKLEKLFTNITSKLSINGVNAWKHEILQQF